MSSGKQLQEMEVGTKQSKTAVNANAKAGMPMDTSVVTKDGQGLTPIEDLGGPTPDNYKPDNDSAKLKAPGGTLKQVKDVVTKNAGKADPMKTLKQGDEAEITDEQEVVAEEPATEEVVAEAEVSEESVEETVEIPDIEEDVAALLSGEELTEEFKAKAKTIFEAAVTTRVAEARAEIEASHAAKLEEEVAEAKGELSERVDSYLEYVSEEWFTENQLAVEHGLKTELTESFLSGMKGLFEEHYVTIPDDKYDVLESMVEKLDDMETKLNEQIEKNITLNSRLGESVADGILSNVSEGLASTQKEKLASLAESVEFESEESYREKLEVLKESYFTSKPTASTKSENLSEGVDIAPENVQGTMGAYLNTLSRFK
jgi:hypothetical protein